MWWVENSVEKVFPFDTLLSKQHVIGVLLE